jgi:1-acyl-sn-glycerol-3-phosphate acyltransferase
MVASRIDADEAPASIEGRRGSAFWTLYTWAHVLFWLGLGALAAVAVGGVARLCGDRHGRVAQACITAAFRAVVKLHPRYQLTITGMENLPARSSVVCPNHQSLSDVVYLFSLPLGLKWVIKRELFAIPLFGAAMRVAGYLEIDRGDSSSAFALMSRAKRYLEAGLSVLSFPEGTRSRDGSLQRFQSGPVRLALEAGVPLVPVGVVGTGGLLPRSGMSYPARAHVRIHIGPPIETANQSRRDARALTRQLRAAVQVAKEEALRHEAPRRPLTKTATVR